MRSLKKARKKATALDGLWHRYLVKFPAIKSNVHQSYLSGIQLLHTHE